MNPGLVIRRWSNVSSYEIDEVHSSSSVAVQHLDIFPYRRNTRGASNESRVVSFSATRGNYYELIFHSEHPPCDRGVTNALEQPIYLASTGE